MNKAVTFLTIALLTISTYLFAAQNRNLESVLLEAASAGQVDIVKSFLDNGANIEVKNELGATPLIFASAKGQAQVVAMLLEKGANVNAMTSTGITPLMAAASGGYADVAKLLLSKSADVCAKDKEGRTALSMAEDSGDSEVYDLLKSADKCSHPQERVAARQPREGSRQQSHDYSDFSSAESQPSDAVSSYSQDYEGPMAGPADVPQSGPLGGLLNDPVIGQLLSRIPGFQQSGPGQVNVNQNVDQGAQMQAPAQGGNAPNQPPAQGGGAQGPAGQAKGADPNLVVTPITDETGFVGTKTFDRTTGETRITGTRTDPKKGYVQDTDSTRDKSGKLIRETSTETMPDNDPNNKDGQKIIKREFGPDNILTNISETHVSEKGDFSKTTNFNPNDPKVKTSEVTVRANGSTTTTTYGGCKQDGTGCKLVSNVDTDPKTGKQTTTTYDPKDGHVTGTQVSDIPKDDQQKAAAFKALKKPKDVAGNNQKGVANGKKQVRADVLNQIQNKPGTNPKAGAKDHSKKGQAQAGNAQNQGQAKGADPNLVVTKSTTPDGTVVTKTFDRTKEETTLSHTRKDPKTGAVIKESITKDKSGALVRGTETITGPDHDPNNKGGRLITRLDLVDGALEKTSETHVSANRDSSKTTNFDPKNPQIKTSEVEVRADRGTTTTNFNGCMKDGTRCKVASKVDRDPKTGKVTTTRYDPISGKVTGASSYTEVKKLGVNHTQGVQQQGVANDKNQMQADVLNQIGGKPSGDLKDAKDKLKTTGAADKSKKSGATADLNVKSFSSGLPPDKAAVKPKSEDKLKIGSTSPAETSKTPKDKPKTTGMADKFKKSGASADLNPQPLPPGPPPDKVGAKPKFDDKFKAESKKKNVKEEFPNKGAFTHGSNVKEKTIQQGQFSEGSKHKAQNWSAEQFKGKTKSHDFNMPAGSANPLQRFR